MKKRKTKSTGGKLIIEISKHKKSETGDKGTWRGRILSPNGKVLWTREKNVNLADLEDAIALLITSLCAGKFAIVNKD